MCDSTYNLWSIILSVISLLVAAVGLYAVYYQIKKLQQSNWSNTHSILSSQSLEILKFFGEHPETYPYFYEKKVLEKGSSDKIIILYAAEALANFIEQLVLQKDNMPEKQWDVWYRFILTTFDKSVVVKTFLNDNRRWYADELMNISDNIS